MKYLLFFVIVSGLLHSCMDSSKKTADPNVYYTCSMDPQVAEQAPGSCPVCAMPLTQVMKGQMEKEDELRLSDQQIRLGNIKTEEIGMEGITEERLLNGRVTVNENRAVSVTARTMGRIDRLYVRNPGDFIRKGEPLFRIYSEEIALAVRELLLMEEKKKSLAPGTGLDQLLEGARKKLEVLGLESGQVDEIVRRNAITDQFDFLSPVSGVVTSVNTKEGAYVMAGAELFGLADLGTVWVQALMYPQDVKSMKAGLPVSITYPSLPGRTDHGTITFIAPEFGSSSILTSGRIEVSNAGGRLLPGLQAMVTLKSAVTKALVVPTDAIIADSKGSRVWVSAGTNRFRHVMVETGLESGGYTAIINGLSEGDEVVISGAYLLNSEYVVKKGADAASAHQH